MKNYFLSLIFSFTILFAFSANSQLEKGKWNFVKNSDYCYIGSYPIKIDMPEGKSRGDTYILVYRMNKSKDSVVQIEAGYPFNNKEEVDVKIDETNYSFYSDNDTAWTDDDAKVIFAMKKGLDLIVKGTSSRGTKTKDTYSLKGFTAAFNKLTNDC